MLRTFLLLAILSVSTLNSQTYWTSTLISNLNRPVAFDFSPDGRIFLTLKGDIVGPATDARILVYNSTGAFLGTFYDLTDSANGDFERGLLGIAVDPAFAVNHFVYAFYVHRWNNDERLRIVRFTENNNAGTNPAIIFDLDVPDNLPGVHIGGNIHFRPSEPGKLYFVIGDLGSDQTDTALNYAHMLTNPFGKTLRINTNGSVSTDNPFYDDGNPLTGNCDWIWSYGHRNAFDFCFSPVNDSMYVSENGLTTWDEVNMIHPGGNYGWNECEGFFLNTSATLPCTNPAYIPPLEAWGAPLPALTGILVYSDTLMPEFDNHLLVADNDNGYIYDLALGNAPYYDTVLSNSSWIDLTTTGGLTTIREGSDGCIYALNGGYVTNGALYRVCPSWMNVEENGVSGLSLKNYPNPFSTTTTLTYTLPENSELRIVLYDVFGREVAVLLDETQSAGTHELGIDAGKLKLPAGNYCCIFQTADGVHSTLVIVQQ